MKYAEKEKVEQLRKELWIKAAVAYIQSSNSTDKGNMLDWADTALNGFDERFK